MIKTDVLIIGGGPAGMVAAVTAKKNYPLKQVTLIKKENKSVIPCGIPYIFNRLKSVDENILSVNSLKENNIDLVIGEIIEIIPQKKEVILENKVKYNYDKLILATGSKSQLVSIQGIKKRGVFQIKKDYEYLKKLRKAVLKSKKIVIIGGGFIGLELAEELSAFKSISISIIESLEHCLITNFDLEFAIMAEEKLKNLGVNIYTGHKVKKIGGDKSVQFVELDNGDRLESDLVILSIGSKPNIELAKNAGIKIEEAGGIFVDEYLRTSILDIFAIGDCAQTRDYITDKNISVMLASVATSEARIATNNLYKFKTERKNKGTVGVFSTKIGDCTLGIAGLSEQRVKEEGFDYIIGKAEAPNHHPAKLANTEIIKVKLIFSKDSNLLLGGEIIGSESVGEMINILAIAIQQKISLFDFNTWQIATHPLLTSAPTIYPIILAAQNVIFKK